MGLTDKQFVRAVSNAKFVRDFSLLSLAFLGFTAFYNERYFCFVVENVNRKSVWTGLPGWPFWEQISEIRSQITLAGPTCFVWPFGSFLALFQDRHDPLQKLYLTALGPV